MTIFGAGVVACAVISGFVAIYFCDKSEEMEAQKKYETEFLRRHREFLTQSCNAGSEDFIPLAFELTEDIVRLCKQYKRKRRSPQHYIKKRFSKTYTPMKEVQYVGFRRISPDDRPSKPIRTEIIRCNAKYALIAGENGRCGYLLVRAKQQDEGINGLVFNIHAEFHERECLCTVTDDEGMPETRVAEEEVHEASTSGVKTTPKMEMCSKIIRDEETCGEETLEDGIQKACTSHTKNDAHEKQVLEMSTSDSETSNSSWVEPKADEGCTRKMSNKDAIEIISSSDETSSYEVDETLSVEIREKRSGSQSPPTDTFSEEFQEAMKMPEEGRRKRLETEADERSLSQESGRRKEEEIFRRTQNIHLRGTPDDTIHETQEKNRAFLKVQSEKSATTRDDEILPSRIQRKFSSRK